jgi:A/G-specific adenine glycosylase
MTAAGDSGPFTPDPSARRRLHRLLLRWYAAHRRVLPWRDAVDPYHIMVSEFMLQQTQVARVLDHLPRWIARFPDIAALARASLRDVLLAWSGMGYNRRALHLHEAARAIVSEHGGAIPDQPAMLLRLPGFGRYTAQAVACFGFRRRLPLVEVNIRRIFSRLSADMQREDRVIAETEAWRIAELLLPARAFHDWNQALMDLGAMVCTARAPACGRCPFRTLCPSAHRLLPAARPPVPISPEAAARSARAMVRETPRRLHRGRVVEHLRGARSHCADAAKLHDLLFADAPEEERARLLDILAALQRDGLVRCAQGRKAVADPRAFTAPLAALRVCLAD